nr:MAG TPA: hypothetical protein [Caudoviricetes sp.]
MLTSAKSVKIKKSPTATNSRRIRYRVYCI